MTEVGSLGESSGSGGGDWKPADLPKGYSDITEDVELRGCELLNADDGAGPVKVLFDSSKPSALNKDGKASPKKDFVQSGADDQLLLFIPFQSIVKLHTLQVRFRSRAAGEEQITNSGGTIDHITAAPRRGGCACQAWSHPPVH